MSLKKKSKIIKSPVAPLYNILRISVRRLGPCLALVYQPHQVEGLAGVASDRR